MLLHIENLAARVGEVEVLRGLNLQVKEGEVHAIMGPNGSGKSSLSKIVAGHPDYQVVAGSVALTVDGVTKDVLAMEPHERAQAGIFVGFQYPVEVPGLTNFSFLFHAYNSLMEAHGVARLTEAEFTDLVHAKMKMVQMNPDFLHRPVNLGFSGGEKKRNEILQLLLLNPRLAILDEIDSGLDIDALKTVAQGIQAYRNQYNGVILITHYQRLLDYVRPDYVHVMVQGRICQSGGWDLVLKLEQQGYDWVTTC